MAVSSLPARLFSNSLVKGALAACLLVWSIAAGLIALDRHQSLLAEVQRNDNLVLAQQLQVEQSLDALDQLLRVARRDFTGPNPPSDVAAWLAELQVDEGSITNIGVVDATGQVQLSLRAGVPTSVVEREYFIWHKGELRDVPFMGVPLQGKQTGVWVLTLTRRITLANGEFGGVVLVSVRPEMFSGGLLRSNLDADASMALIGLDGVTRVQRRGERVSFGQRVSQSQLFTELRHAPFGNYESRPDADGGRLLVSYRQLERFPLVAEVASSVSVVMEPVHQRALVHVAGATAWSILIVVLAAVLMRNRQRQRTAMSRLAQSEARYRQLFDQNLDGVLGVDLTGVIRAANPAAGKLLGLSANELLGTSLFEQCETGGDDARSWFAELPSDGQGLVAVQLRRRGGQAFEAELSASLDRQQAQGDGLANVVMRDISSRKAAEEAERGRVLAERANQAKSAFMSRMSHELRTPLNAILGFSQLLLSDRQAPLARPQQEHVDRVLGAGRHLLALIDDLLDLSRLDADVIHLRPEALPLRPLLQEVQTTLQAEALANRVSLVIEDDPGGALSPAPWVQADAVRLRQVLINLLSNAIKYNRPGGQVTLAARLVDDRVELAVIDTGLGMTAAQQAQLFQPFNRLGRENGGIAGTGIGLAICQRLVRLMQGDLRVHSVVNVGSTFTLVLPGAQAPAPTVSAAISMAGFDASLQCVLAIDSAAQGVVLVVEDEPVNRELVRACLSRRPGLVLQFAGSMAEAMTLARRHPPRLALIDMMLPDGDGATLLGRLRALPGQAGLTALAVSANAMPEFIGDALRAGFNAYITKPFELVVMLREVDQALAGTALSQQRQVAGHALRD